ncbi:hypothetical protein BUZ97_12160 [Mammaliicoccus sciuri]|nr:hypothetical protein BUZ97_12160 [Mammaliicoccus sciuri]
MSDSDIFFDFNKPIKWKFNLILIILFLSLTAFINSQLLYTSSTFKNVDSNTMDSLKIFIIVVAILFIILKNVALVSLHLLFLSIIARFKSTSVKFKYIFSATLFLFLLTSFFKLLVSFTQYIFEIDPNDYNIGSLNILDKGNTFLTSFDFVHIISTYIIFQILYKTFLLDKKTSFFISFIYYFIVLLSLISLNILI